MANWIRIVTFTDAGLKQVRQSPGEVLAKIAATIASGGGTLLQVYATLGPFDLMSIIEARDEAHMEALDRVLASNGLYHAINVPAVPVGEFVRMAQGSPVFLKAWLDGREHRLAAATKETTPPPKGPRAASPPTERKPGVNTRRGRRSTGATGLKLGLGSLPAVDVVSLSLGPGEAQGAFLVRLPEADAQRAGLTEMARDAKLAVHLELVAEKSRLALQANLVRVDAASDGGAYDLLVEARELPRALVTRLDRVVRAAAR